MMANWNFNYIYDIPPNEGYQEFGDEPNETHAVPFVYSPIIYNVQYTGVSSFEYNGTTFYNYNVYEAPVLSFYNYSGHDYSTEVNTDDYNANVVTEDVYDYSVEVSTEYYNADVVTEDGHDYSVEVYAASYNSNIVTEDDYDYSVEGNADNYNSNFDAEDGSNNNYYQQRPISYNTVSSHISTDFSPSISYDNFTAMRNKDTDSGNVVEYDINTSAIITNINTSAINTDAESNNCNESNVLEHFTDIRKNNLYEDSEELSFVYEENKISDWSIEVEGNAESDNCNESNLLEHVIDLRKNNLYEDSEEQSFVYEENRIMDWSIEVEDNDIKEEDDDSFKVNFSTSDDIEPYRSTEVIKYLKENLYLYALSGHMSLKESIPVVDILPTIDEEPESVEEDYSLKRAVADLEQEEENIQSVIEKNELADLSIDRSHPFIECHALEYTVEDSEQATKNNPEFAENNLSSVEAVYTFQQNQSISEYQATQRDEMVNNDDKIPTKDTKLINFNADCTSLASGKELQMSVENVLNHVETDNVFKPVLKLPQMHNHERGYQSKLQNNCIEIVEENGATQIKSLCPETDTQLKPSEEVEISKEVISNQFDSIKCRVPEEMEAHVECYSERNVEKVVEVDEKERSKAKKKKFHTLRKWMGNLCCCARKKDLDFYVITSRLLHFQ